MPMYALVVFSHTSTSLCPLEEDQWQISSRSVADQ